MGIGPYGGYKKCGKRAVGDAGPYGGSQEVRGERNPPVTALPRQPPLGKGAKGTGDADCHSQCAHWLRNDRLFCKGCGGESTGGQRRPPLRMTRNFVQVRERGDVGIAPYEILSVNTP